MSESPSAPSADFDAALRDAASSELPALWLAPDMRVLSLNGAARALLTSGSGTADLRLADCLDESVRRDFEAFWEEWIDKPALISYRLDCRLLGMRQVDLVPWGGNILMLLRGGNEGQMPPVLDSRLIQSQKMETIGRLAGGLAHSLNNTLMGVIGYCELAMMDVEEGHPVRFHLETIKEIGEKASKLSRQLLAYSRKQQLHLGELALGPLIRDMEPMLHHWLGQKAWLKTALLDRCPVLGDRGQIEQVIMNLVFNARDAMPEGGRLSLCTRDIDVDEEMARAFPGLKPGAYGLLQVLDRGSGMSEEILANIFEPFYTTKGHGKGTGLGLATVYGVIKQHRGYIGVDSEPGRGSSFTLLIPRTGTRAEDAASPAATAVPRHCLVLSEDKRWTHYLVSALRALGAETYAGWAGLQRWRRGPCLEGEATVLLLDETLRHSSRERLAAAGIVPGAFPILVFSGLGSQDALLPRGDGEPLPKLIAASELVAALACAASRASDLAG